MYEETEYANSEPRRVMGKDNVSGGKGRGVAQGVGQTEGSHHPVEEWDKVGQKLSDKEAAPHQTWFTDAPATLSIAGGMACDRCGRPHNHHQEPVGHTKG